MCSNRVYIVSLLVLFYSCAFAERHDIHAEADRPGMGTGTNILDRGCVQWETGIEVAHLTNTHCLTLPTVLFRFGLSEWAELRLEYTGLLAINAQPYTNNTKPKVQYMPEPLWVGSKMRLWKGSEQTSLRWVPRTSLLLNLGVPLTKLDAQNRPICGSIGLLFENDITDWLTIGYDLGIDWIDWAPTPDVFASLAFNFMPTEKFGIFIESYNIFDPDAVRADAPTRTYTIYDINLDFGITYMVHPHVQLDANAGFNLYHSESYLSSPKSYSFFGIGVTWLLHQTISK